MIPLACRQRRSGMPAGWLVVRVVCAVLVAVSTGCADTPATVEVVDGEADYAFVVPAGTADRVARGEPVNIMPNRLEVKVGEVIRIENNDDEGTTAGPYYVPAGSTIVQRFDSAGRYVGECAISTDGSYEIVVTEP